MSSTLCRLSPRALTSKGKRERVRAAERRRTLRVSAHKVEIEHKSGVHRFDVSEDETILDVALEAGLDLPHDCRLGVCMTCPARLVSGDVDQSGSMLSEDVTAQGYALLCVSKPLSDCHVKTIGEDELLDLQLKTSQY